MTDSKPYEQAEEVASLRKQNAELLEALVLLVGRDFTYMGGVVWQSSPPLRMGDINKARDACRNAGGVL